MSDTMSLASEEATTWIRCRHRQKPEIEYDVQIAYEGATVPFQGEECYRIRTIRNLLYKEEVHQPAYTYMPADRFLETYERAQG